MNDNDIYSIDFTRSLPPVLKNDPKMIALARTIAEQLQVTARHVVGGRLFPVLRSAVVKNDRAFVPGPGNPKLQNVRVFVAVVKNGRQVPLDLRFEVH